MNKIKYLYLLAAVTAIAAPVTPALAQAFPPRSSDAARALDKYIAVLERLLF